MARPARHHNLEEEAWYAPEALVRGLGVVGLPATCYSEAAEKVAHRAVEIAVAVEVVLRAVKGAEEGRKNATEVEAVLLRRKRAQRARDTRQFAVAGLVHLRNQVVGNGTAVERVERRHGSEVEEAPRSVEAAVVGQHLREVA